MLYEKKKLLIHRLVWGILLLAGILTPIIVATVMNENVKMLDSDGYINYYYESTNQTSCEIEVTFNSDINYGNITVAFYDSNGKFLAEKTGYLFGYGKTQSATFYINGKVDSYEVLEFDVTIESWLLIDISITVDIGVFVFFIGSLLLSCKKYSYNDKEIIVYAGWYHHYIKVDGIKVDEHNTLISYTAITMSCILEDGTDLKATVTKTNRISLKINNRLYTNQLPLSNRN